MLYEVITNYPYLEDILSYVAVGARSVENLSKSYRRGPLYNFV